MEEKAKKDREIIGLEDLEKVRLSRRHLADMSSSPHFEEYVTGECVCVAVLLWVEYVLIKTFFGSCRIFCEVHDRYRSRQAEHVPNMSSRRSVHPNRKPLF